MANYVPAPGEDHHNCPICYTLPEAEVFQCRKGHVLCSKCYSKLVECPQCSEPLDKQDPIRNRYMESVLDGLVLECPFKSNGCEIKLERGLLQIHQNGCCYDFDKFGKFAKICHIFGSPKCSFVVNNGNTKDAVRHIVCAHLGQLGQQGHKNVKQAFGKLPKEQENFPIYSKPMILDLPDKQCYLLIMSTWSKQNPLEPASVSWYSLFLPYKNNEGRLNPSPVQVEFALSNADPVQPFNMNFVLDPMTITSATSAFVLENYFPQLPVYFLEKHFAKNGKLIVDYKVKDRQT